MNMEGKSQSYVSIPLEAILPSERFGVLLSTARQALGLSVTKVGLAQVIGVDRYMLDNWEEGASFPPEDKLSALASAYKINEGKLRATLKVSREANKRNSDARKLPEQRKLDPNNSAYPIPGVAQQVG